MTLLGSVACGLLSCYHKWRQKSVLQVRIYWQWLEYTQRRAGVSRPLLLLNLDETSVKSAIPPPVGVVAESTPISVTKADWRGSSTLIAVVCSCPSMQELMPSFLICNKRRVSFAGLAVIQRMCPNNFIVWRTDSAWNTASGMIRILQKLSHQLAPFVQYCQPVLTLDAAPCHTALRVLEHARKLNIKLVFIPAHCTPLLQVLDVFIFKDLKAWLQREFQQSRSLRAGGFVTTLDWFQILMRVPSFLQRRSWAVAFERTTALSNGQVTRHLEALGVERATSLQPTPHDLALLFPRRRLNMLMYRALLGGRLHVYAHRIAI